MRPRQIYRRLLHYLRPYVWPRLAVAIPCMFVYSSSNLAMPFLVQHILDDVFISHNVIMLRWLPLAVIAVFVVRGLANFGNNYLMEYIGQRVLTDLRDELNDRIQYLPLSYFNRTPTGTIV